MQLNRLPRSQFLLPACTTRSLGFVQQRALSSSIRLLNRVKQTSGANTLSLFEELFPEESKLSENVRKPIRADENSKGPFKEERLQEFATFKALRPGLHHKLAGIEWERHDKHKTLEPQNASIVVLSNASKSLSLSDFLRLSPKGKHIDGWASGIIKGKSHGIPVCNSCHLHLS